jgi:hypothetical protein
MLSEFIKGYSLVSIIGAAIIFALPAHAADLEVPAATGGDDTALIQSVLDLAQPGDRVLFASGQTYNHGNTLTVSEAEDVELVGRGASLVATNSARAALIVQDSAGVRVGGLRLVATATARSASDRTCGLVAYRTEGLEVVGNSVGGFAGCGIMVQSSTLFRVQGNVVQDTFADGIHTTNGSFNGVISSNLVFDSGDDGIAVVSYRRQDSVTHGVLISGNAVFKTPGPATPGRPAYHGRGIAIDGGEDVTIDNNYIENSASAGVLVASSSAYDCWPVSRVTVTRNTLVASNQDAGVYHGALLVSGRAEGVITDVRVEGNVIVDTVGADAHLRVSANTVGVVVLGNAFEDADNSHRAWTFYRGAGATASGNTYNGAPTP